MRIKLAVLLIIILAAVFGVYKYVDKKDAPATSQNTASTQSNNQEVKDEPSFPVIDLQPVVDEWANKQSGQASVVVYDLSNKKTVASLNPDEQYFTASIYKLYVAYEGYKKVAAGTYSMNDTYLSGYNRGKCLDAMIRDSYSPCGEKMWAELGKDTVTNTLKTYGLKNTSMTGLSTSAGDSALILARLMEHKDLNEEHTDLFLDSMKTQDAKYRRGLPSGFTKSTVYDKVGWNEQVEWHDTAIVTLPNGRSYVITVFTEKVGYSNIATLGKSIEAKLTE